MSTLNVDALVGVSSANAITVRGEGSATTNLQQGLAKVWFQAVGAGTSYNDSFNTNNSSLTDQGAGNITCGYIANMANSHGSLTMGNQYSSSGGTGSYFANAGSRATSSHGQQHYQGGSATDPVMYNSTVHGDLA